jgi:tetratricopeptide (TPR) repeat protein
MPVIDALAPLVADEGYGLHEFVRTHAPSWRSQFPAAYAGEDIASTPPTPARLARELGDALSAAARCRPVVMILEDLHWADPSTIELLRHLAHRASRAALLMIATCRGEEAAAAGSSINQVLAELEARGVCESIELSRLDEASIREYLEERFGLILGEVLPRLASLLFKATEGHPLFVVSLVQLFIQRGDLQHTGHAWQLTTPIDRLRVVIPRTVEAVIRRKLAALEDADRRLLQHASIEGQEFSTAILSALSGVDSAALEERLEGLAKGPRIVAAVGQERYDDATWGARYQFAHALYHNLVYQDLTPSRKADLHRQVGDRLLALHDPERTPVIAAQLARHFKEGRDWDRAFEYYVHAGDNSMMLSATLEAEGHYGQAIGLASAEGTNIEPWRLAIAYYKRAHTRVVLGNSSMAMTDYQEALVGASKASDQDLAFEIRVAIAYLHGFAQRIDDAIKASADLQKDAERRPSGSKHLTYLILDLQLRMSCGDLDQAAVAADTAIALARSFGDLRRLRSSLCVRARIHYYRSEYESALTHLREACGSADAETRRQADPRPRYVHFSGVQFLGLTLADLGRMSEALSLLQSELEIARTDGYGYWVPIMLNAISRLYGEIGDVDAALCHAEEASRETFGEDTELAVESRLNMAAACSRLGHLDRAASLLAEADGLTKQGIIHEWLWRIHLDVRVGELALSRGAPTVASDYARKAAALARRYGVWKQVVMAERLLAEAAAAEGDWPGAGALVQQALDTLGMHPVPIIAWKVHATAARIHRHRGQRAEAAAALDRARTEVRRLSEQIHEERLKTTFLESHDVRDVMSDASRD